MLMFFNIFWRKVETTLFLNYPDPNMSMGELKGILDIIVVSGYNALPRKRFYWDSGTDMANEMFEQAMHCARLVQIMHFIHCANNTEKLDHNDEMWKLKNIINKLKPFFQKYYQPNQNMNCDESMVKYNDRHHCKQFIRGNPLGLGTKCGF